MPPDRLLNTVLQYYQDVHDVAKTEQIIGTTTHLLTQLSNPLNLGVLTSQLLTAPAIWQRDDGLRTAIRIVSIYNTAAVRVRDHDAERAKHNVPGEGGGLRPDAWVRAVVKGADDRSRRWQHLLVLTGVLMGMEGNDKRTLPRALRNTLEQAVVTAANLALEGHLEDGPMAGSSIVLALNFAFPLLSDYHKAQINCNALLPIAVWAVTAEEGFGNGQFLLAINQETTVAPGRVLAWHAQAPSFRLLQEMDKRPLMGSMGPLSKLAAFAVQNATDTAAVLEAQDTLLVFTQKVLAAWQANRFSDIDPSLESSALTPETLRTTWVALWQTLRKLMFGVVVLLQAIVARSLLDPIMLHEAAAPGIAAKSLHILRNLFFVSSRNGNNAFQVYTFAYLTTIDILSRSVVASEGFLRDTRPSEVAAPTTHLQRTLDLFYLNVAEHLPLNLSTEAAEFLVIKPASVYLSHDGPMTPAMVELFESAHSAILAVLSYPQHSSLTINMAPFYIVRLFESFPRYISSRQFRVAFKTVMQVVSPPFPIAAMEPHLSETLLEMLRSYMANAGTATLPPSPDAVSQGTESSQDNELVSEQSSLALALIDSIPFLPLPLIEEWLTISAQTLSEIADGRLREPVKKRFWEMLVSGEMDVERAAVGVAWWGTRGGRELVLSGGATQPAMMSGAIVSDEQPSKL